MPSPETSEIIESLKLESKYLQEYSECVYDILEIVKTVIDHPGEYKELNLIYFNLIKELEKKMESSDRVSFKDEGYSIPFGLIFMPFRKDDEKEEFYKAEKNMKFLLGELENERIHLLGDKYKPSTGSNNPELILILENIKNSGKEVTPQKAISETDIKIPSKNRTEVTSKTIAGEKILNIDSKEINIGSIKNGPNKLWECLSPIGSSKTTEITFTLTNPIKGKYVNDTTLTIFQKENILKNRFKELQRVISKNRVKISLVFNHNNNTVHLELNR